MIGQTCFGELSRSEQQKVYEHQNYHQKKSQTTIHDLKEISIQSNSITKKDDDDSAQSFYCNKKVVCGLIVSIFIVILAIAIPISLLKSRQVYENSTMNKPYQCLQNLLCLGVRDDVQHYILTNYKKFNQINILLKTAKAMERIQREADSAVKSQQIFEEQFRLIECLSQTFGQRFGDVYLDLQKIVFNNGQRILQFLEMINNIGSQPLQLNENNEGCITQGRLLHNQRVLLQNNESILILIDGIGHTPFNTYQNIKLLNKLTDQKIQTKFGTKIYLKPNGGDSNIFYDIIISYQQKRRQYNLEPIKRQLLIQYLLIIVSPLRKNSVDIPLNEQFLNYAYEKIHQRAIDVLSYNSNLINIMKRIYKFNKRIVIIGYQLGAFTSNVIYEKLCINQSQSISLISIGPLSNYIDGNGKYITNPSDFVINNLIEFSNSLNISQPLEANVPPKKFNCLRYQNKQFCTNHSLFGYIESYSDDLLRYIKLGKQLVQSINVEQVSSIKASITWNTTVDINLHVYQPYGNHIYYGNKQNQVGYLIEHKKNSSGPQIYIVQCPFLIEGTYTFKLNYLKGSDPVKIFATINAGMEQVTKQIVIQRAYGLNGSYNPPNIIGAITVHQNFRTGEYSYQINF